MDKQKAGGLVIAAVMVGYTSAVFGGIWIVDHGEEVAEAITQLPGITGPQR